MLCLLIDYRCIDRLFVGYAEYSPPNRFRIASRQNDAKVPLQTLQPLRLTRESHLKDLVAVSAPLEVRAIEDEGPIDLAWAVPLDTLLGGRFSAAAGDRNGLGVEGEADTHEFPGEEAAWILLGPEIHDGEVFGEELDVREAVDRRPGFLVTVPVLVDPELVVAGPLHALGYGSEAQTGRGRGCMVLHGIWLQLERPHWFVGAKTDVYDVAVSLAFSPLSGRYQGDDVETVREAGVATLVKDARPSEVDVETEGEQDGVEEGVVLHAVAAAALALAVEDDLVVDIVGLDVDGAVGGVVEGEVLEGDGGDVVLEEEGEEAELLGWRGERGEGGGGGPEMGWEVDAVKVLAELGRGVGWAVAHDSITVVKSASLLEYVYGLFITLRDSLGVVVVVKQGGHV